MKQYLDLAQRIIDCGEDKSDRTGVGTRGIFGPQLEFDLRDGFPAVTTKKLQWASVVKELQWFLRGETNSKTLGCGIWDSWRRPYNLDRENVFVSPRTFDYQPATQFDGGGNIPRTADSLGAKLHGLWSKMISRCYDESSHNYKWYGGNGVSVNIRWHKFANFYADCQLLPHWKYKLNDWNSFDLDKDYYGSNQYGPLSCVWLSVAENIGYSSCPVSVLDAQNAESLFINLGACSRLLGISTSSLHRFCNGFVPKCLKGNNKRFDGFRFSYKDIEGKLLRLALIEDGDMGPVYGKSWRSWESGSGAQVDQIQSVINTIINDPMSRRHIVSAWNVAEINNMALPPCHLLFQFHVGSICGKPTFLDCKMYQRSADYFLGVPFNIASYGLLTHVIARLTGLTPRRLIMSYGDVHLYKNQIVHMETQISRSPKQLPSLELPEFGDIDTFAKMNSSMIKLCNYRHDPSLKCEVAI